EVLRRLRTRGVPRRGRLPTRHLPRDPHPEAGVRARLLESLQAPVRPDRRSALLVALVYELDLFRSLFPAHDRLDLAVRASEIRATVRQEAHYFDTTIDLDAHAPSDSPGRADRFYGLALLLQVAVSLLD